MVNIGYTQWVGYNSDGARYGYNEYSSDKESDNQELGCDRNC